MQENKENFYFSSEETYTMFSLKGCWHDYHFYETPSKYPHVKVLVPKLAVLEHVQFQSGVLWELGTCSNGDNRSLPFPYLCL